MKLTLSIWVEGDDALDDLVSRMRNHYSILETDFTHHFITLLVNEEEAQDPVFFITLGERFGIHITDASWT